MSDETITHDEAVENLSYEAKHLDDETLEQAAREALEMPSHFYRRDRSLYDTHTAVFAYAPDSDDIMAESNHHVALEVLEALNVERDPDHNDETRDVYTSSVGHWTYSSFNLILVRVFTDETRTEYTPAFREAVALALAVQDYPILDESDYSEREWREFERVLDMAINDAVRDVERDLDLDLDEDRDDIAEYVHWWVSARGQWCVPDDVDWRAVEAQVREYLRLKAENPDALRWAEDMPGQTRIAV